MDDRAAAGPEAVDFSTPGVARELPLGRGRLPNAPSGPPWTCGACGHDNQGGATCEVCGVAKRYFEDPPLDLPPTPRLSQLPSFWLAVAWSVAGAAGGILLLFAPLREAIGIGTTFLVLEFAAAAAAAGSTFMTALWERLFNQFELQVPAHVRSGEPLPVELRLVPYRTMTGVNLSFKLIDRFYERGRGSAAVQTSSQHLGSLTALRSGSLRARRAHVFAAEFLAPFPATPHQDVRAEVMADLYGAIGVVVPALRWHARNLREHGGYYVEAHLRVGLLRRRLQRRVVAYHLGENIVVG